MDTERKYLNICKTIAILLVISVHMKVSYSGPDVETYEKITKIIYDFGLAGVGVFFFVSGYVYNYNVRYCGQQAVFLKLSSFLTILILFGRVFGSFWETAGI